MSKTVSATEVRCDDLQPLLLLKVKFIYSEKATKFCEISTLDLSYVVPVKSTVEIFKILWPFQNILTLTQSGSNLAVKGIEVTIFWEGHINLKNSLFVLKFLSNFKNRFSIFFRNFVASSQYLNFCFWNEMHINNKVILKSYCEAARKRLNEKETKMAVSIFNF